MRRCRPGPPFLLTSAERDQRQEPGGPAGRIPSSPPTDRWGRHMHAAAVQRGIKLLNVALLTAIQRQNKLFKRMFLITPICFNWGTWPSALHLGVSTHIYRNIKWMEETLGGDGARVEIDCLFIMLCWHLLEMFYNSRSIESTLRVHNTNVKRQIHHVFWKDLIIIKNFAII